MVRFNTIFRARWRGHEIAAYNWWNLWLRTGEELWIDGTRVASQTGGPLRFAGTLTAQVEIEGESTDLRAYFGPIDLGTRVGCQLIVNGEQIAGEGATRFLPGFGARIG
jgi:hypothetical protein